MLKKKKDNLMAIVEYEKSLLEKASNISAKRRNKIALTQGYSKWELLELKEDGIKHLF